MSRPFARLKLGYYALPTEEARNIHSVLVASAPYSAIDPCAGDGSALLEITNGTGAHLAAIEVDADRAVAAAQRGIPTVHGSAFECKVQSESCSLLYLNPPYDTELGPHSNKRMEFVFLDHCYRWVRADGVLVFVIPATVLNSCSRLLASQFDRLCVFRLGHPECVRFHQTVVFGTRKKPHSRGEPRGADMLVRAGYRPDSIPSLHPDVGERYFVSPSGPATINYTGLPLDTVEDAIERSVAMQNARGVLVRKQQKMSGRPVTPLHKGHVGLLACSGMLNGFFGQGEERHIAHWRAVKHVDEFNEEGEEAGGTILRRRERFSHELTLAFENGRILELKETTKDGRDACPKKQLKSSNMRARCRGAFPSFYLNQHHRGIAMKNAHERFGKVVYVRRTEKTATNIRLHLDAFIGEERGKAHFVSVIGGDVEIGAISAAFGNGDLFTVIDPTLAESIVSLGDRPLLFRGSIVVAGRKRPLRHLVACSQELADTSSDGKLLLVSDDDTFIWSSLVSHYGLPATPEWRQWMLAELRSQRRIYSLPGFGYQGIAITATRKQLLALLSRGLRNRHLGFPLDNGPVEWPNIGLAKRA